MLRFYLMAKIGGGSRKLEISQEGGKFLLINIVAQIKGK